MSGMLLLAQAGLNLSSLLLWGVLLGAAGLALRTATQAGWRKFGSGLGLVSLGLIFATLPHLGEWLPQGLFWVLAAVTVIASGIAVTARSPVYSAIWFAVSLLGAAGLYLLQGAHFLGVATIVVYAGAIIVTFLFVLMLAQAEGHSPYDRISWAGFAPPMAALAVGLLIGMVAVSFQNIPSPVSLPEDVLHERHVARLGAELFARQLIGVEIAGTLLLVALVGAIAIVIHGRARGSAALASAATPGSAAGGSRGEERTHE